MLRRIRYRVLAPAVAVFLPFLAPVQYAKVLKAGSVWEQEIAGGEAYLFQLEGQTGQNLLVTVVQDGINVAINLRKSDGSSLGTVDGVEQRHGFERFFVALGDDSTAWFEIRSQVANSPVGRCRIEVKELLASVPELSAEKLMTQADLLASQSAEGPLRKALETYLNSIQVWRALGRKQDEARTLLRLAVVHQRLGEWQAMLNRLDEALLLFSAHQYRAGEGDTLNYRGIAQTELSQFRDAITSYERSAEIRRSLGDRYGEAVTWQNGCLVRLHMGEWRNAITCYEKAISMLEEAGAPSAEAFNGLGGAYSQLGEPQKARQNYTRALEQWRAVNDKAGEADLLNNLGVLAANQGSLGEALSYYGQALEVYRNLGNHSWEALILNNQGHAYLLLGEPGRAIEFFEEALVIRIELGEQGKLINTLDNLGLARQQLGDIAKAVAAYEQALKIAQETRNSAGEAASLNLLAYGKIAAGDLRGAQEVLQRAVAFQRQLGYRSGLALALRRTGEVEAALGQRGKSLPILEESLELYQALGDRSGQAASLAAMAAVERDLGQFEQALTLTDRAIGFIESVRATVGEPSLRASFLASRRLAFELAIDLRMELDGRQPGRGNAAEALALNERARARSLLDLLYEAGADLRRGTNPKLREQQENLALRFSINARKQLSAKTEELRAEVQRELTTLLAEADRLEDEIRQGDPRYAGLVQAIDAAGIGDLLDRDTVLLEYSLGEDRSFVWAVTPDHVDGFILPSRAEIEKAARRVYQDLHQKQVGADSAEAAVHLSRLLFGPMAERLKGKRLVIVADGALHFLPFAALPDPGDASGHTPLLVGHEIVSLPSASVLEVQRRMLAGRPPAPKAIAIFADPVFTAWDSRLRRGVKRDSPPADLRTNSRPPAVSLGFQRLLESGREATAIAALFPPDQVFSALGLDASRRNVLGGELAKFRMVHFATHGLIKSETPQLSALVLSTVDAEGLPQEGLLGLRDIYNLELKADLAVLSGCETALGREIRGEGLVGLTQGFFYAGAERVMASLWRVEDQATAELMTHFYRAMLQGGLPPAAALRSAQLAIRSNPRWQDPVHWAPFVLQGDWR